jgi:hypothetical protein
MKRTSDDEMSDCLSGCIVYGSMQYCTWKRAMSDCLSGCVMYGSMQYLEEGDERLSQRVHVVQLRADHAKYTPDTFTKAQFGLHALPPAQSRCRGGGGAGGEVDGGDAGGGKGGDISTRFSTQAIQ